MRARQMIGTGWPADGRRGRILQAWSRSGFQREELAMGDKSPKSHMTTKAKSLKEKRADKHAKSAAKDHIEIVPPKSKR
jgi:hypothetical protein